MNNAHLLDAASKIVRESLQTVSENYGDGIHKAEQAPFKGWRDYHNLGHSVDTYNRATALAGYIGLPLLAVTVAGMAAAAHDVYHEGGRGAMEQKSAAWLTGKMERAGFSGRYIRCGALAVLGTEPIFDAAGYMTGQVVDVQQYPSVEAEAIAKVVASADMAGMYQPHGPQLGRLLFKEMNSSDESDDFPLDGLLAFQGKQQFLLENYRFPLAEAEVVFGGLRQPVIGHQLSVTQALQTGEISRWAELDASDEAFAARYGQKD